VRESLGVAGETGGQRVSRYGVLGPRSDGNHFAATVDAVPACDAQQTSAYEPG